MTTNDTLNLAAYPFYQWDSVVAAQPQADTAAPGCNGVPMDSIFKAHEVQDTVYRKSMFTHHNMPVQHSELIVRNEPAQPAWLFVILILITALLCIYMRAHKIGLKELGQSLLDSRAMDRNLRNNNLTHNAMLSPMGLLVTAAISVAVHTTAMAHTGLVGYLLLWLGLTGAYMTRNGIIYLLGNLFDNRAGANIYVANNYLFHLALSIAVVPMLFPMVYAPWGGGMIYAIAGVTAVEFIMRFYNGMKLFLTQSKDFYFHLFYYLCTVELIPILVLIKFIVG